VIFVLFRKLELFRRNVDNPSVKLDNTCRAGFFELKKHREMKRRQKHEMGADAYKHYKWVGCIFSLQISIILLTDVDFTFSTT
jgi:hypothetical protein